MASDITPVIVGILSTLILGFIVKCIFRVMTEKDKPRPPKDIDSAVWEEIIGRRDGGMWLGWIECIFSFCMFWIEAEAAIAGWFAFKVATKWEAWANIVKFPDKLNSCKDELDLLRARSQLGAWIMSKFAIGSLLNILAGFFGSVIGHFLGPFFTS